jgi:hypothetical protein
MKWKEAVMAYFKVHSMQMKVEHVHTIYINSLLYNLEHFKESVGNNLLQLSNLPNT